MNSSCHGTCICIICGFKTDGDTMRTRPKEQTSTSKNNKIRRILEWTFFVFDPHLNQEMCVYLLSNDPCVAVDANSERVRIVRHTGFLEASSDTILSLKLFLEKSSGDCSPKPYLTAGRRDDAQQGTDRRRRVAPCMHHHRRTIMREGIPPGHNRTIIYHAKRIKRSNE